MRAVKEFFAANHCFAFTTIVYMNSLDFIFPHYESDARARQNVHAFRDGKIAIVKGDDVWLRLHAGDLEMLAAHQRTQPLWRSLARAEMRDTLVVGTG